MSAVPPVFENTPRSSMALLGSGRGGRGEPDGERASALRAVRGGEVAAQALRDRVRDVEAEAGALAARLRREERVEDPLPRLAGEARAGVLELDEERAPVAAGR